MVLLKLFFKIIDEVEEERFFKDKRLKKNWKKIL